MVGFGTFWGSKMSDDEFTDRLSEYIDGELTPAEHLDFERHLVICARCRTTLDELQAVVAQAAALTDTRPGAALWPGIAARIGEGRAAGLNASPFTRAVMRRVSFTLPQLAAAALALMVLSGGLVWVARSGDPRADFDPVSADTGRAPIAPVSVADPQYDAAVADLEGVLAQERSRLDPETVRVIEANLAAIDMAIAQSREALAADPANMYLNTHLASARQRKLALLRRVTALSTAGS